MSIQTTKNLIGTGVEGVAGTGDTLSEAGKKMNQYLHDLYNVYGDYRVFANDGEYKGDQLQTLHATGYWQKLPRAYYEGNMTPSGNPVDHGSRHDVSTTRDGTGAITVTIPAGYVVKDQQHTMNHQGESIEIINSDGSVSPLNPLIIRCAGSGDVIKQGHERVSELRIDKPEFKITLWVETAGAAGSVWNYRIEHLYGGDIPVEPIKIKSLAPGNTRILTLFHRYAYHAGKFMLFANAAQGGGSESSEILMMNNKFGARSDTNVPFTEYARVRTADPSTHKNDLLYKIHFDIHEETQLVRLHVTNVTNVMIDVNIKCIETIGSLIQ